MHVIILNSIFDNYFLGYSLKIQLFMDGTQLANWFDCNASLDTFIVAMQFHSWNYIFSRQLGQKVHSCENIEVNTQY